MNQRDDAAYLQALLDDADDQHPGEVFTVVIPEGEYRLRRPLIISPRARVDGSGSSIEPHPEWEPWGEEPLIRVCNGGGMTGFRVSGE